MAQIRNKPKDCQHLTCKSGECGKCAYNPRSGYPMFHLSQLAPRTPLHVELSELSIWVYAVAVVIVYLLVL